MTGTSDSQAPVVLPPEATALDAFLRRNPGETYWCGLWLGGCGHELAIKRYTDRVCHFAHLPGAARRCHRTQIGTSSADHLYIKNGLQDWLTSQGFPTAARIPCTSDGEPHLGDVILEPEGRGCLRVVLGGDQEPPATEDTAQLVLGAAVDPPAGTLARDGYIHRIRCVPDGTSRRVQLGTERRDGTTWFDLDECDLASWGLNTPVVAQIRDLRTSTRPIGPLRKRQPTPPQVTVIDALPAPVAAPQPDDDRIAVIDALKRALDDNSGLTELIRCRDRAEQATRAGATAKENTLLRAAADAILRQERGVGVPTFDRTAPRPRNRTERRALRIVHELLGQLRRNDGRMTASAMRNRVQQLAAEARTAQHCLTMQERDEIRAWRQQTFSELVAQDRRPAPPTPSAPGRTQRPSSGRTTPSAGLLRDRADITAEVRDVLEHAARLGKTIRWRDLCAQAGGLAALTEVQQRQVLTDAAPTRSREAGACSHPIVLAALVTTDDGTVHPHYAHMVCLAVDRESVGDAETEQTWAEAVEAVYRNYRR